MKGHTVKTNDKNIDILAWLIDFKPRPSKTYWLLRQKGVEIVSIDHRTLQKTTDSKYMKKKKRKSNKIVLKYPNGVTLSVNPDFELITQLLKL